MENTASVTLRFLLSSIATLAVSFMLVQPASAQQASSLAGKMWTLIEIETEKHSRPEPNMQFAPDQKRVSGSGGCNRFAGGFEVNGSSIKFSHIASTMRACLDQAVQRVETNFLGLLEKIDRFEVDGNILRLFIGDRRILVLTNQPNDGQTVTSIGPAELGGTSWQIVLFKGGDGKTQTPDDKSKYTISFGKDGRLSVRIDCNRGSGAWASNGPNQLHFGPLALTRAMCPPGSLHDHLVRNWNAVRSYLVRDGHLFLMTDESTYEFEPTGSANDVSQRASVTGTVSYRQRIALTPKAIIKVKLVDFSLADTPARIIAEQTLKPAGAQVPIAFNLPYDPARIDSKHRYSIQVQIHDRDELRFATTQIYPVISLGNPNTVTVIVHPVDR